MSITVPNAIALRAGERHMSRMVVEHTSQGGVVKHRMSVVYLDANGEVVVCPFEKETAMTVYHDCTLHLYSHSGLLLSSARDV